jgi:cation transport ATPase
VPEVHIYVNRPPERDAPALKDLEDALRQMDHVYEAKADPTGNVVAVSFEGGRDEQQEIEHTIEETGYEISRLSVRTDFLAE